MPSSPDLQNYSKKGIKAFAQEDADLPTWCRGHCTDEESRYSGCLYSLWIPEQNWICLF